MNTVSKREDECQKAFECEGPYWHAFTSGVDTPVLFTNDSDLVYVMNVIAFASTKSKCKILAFELMNNHFHFVMSGPNNEIDMFWDALTKKLNLSFRTMKDLPLIRKPIKSLEVLRLTIAYVHRNGFVANYSFMPLNYPWGTNLMYFLPLPECQRFNELSWSEKRMMFRGRVPEFPADTVIFNGVILPSCYCDVKLGMAMFRSAGSYFLSLAKNLEAYSEIAKDIQDDEHLVDAELYTKVNAYIHEHYNVKFLTSLSSKQKIELAKKLHFDYHSSNNQIRRILNMSKHDVDELFPFSTSK